jgi:hypothetical protein
MGKALSSIPSKYQEKKKREREKKTYAKQDKIKI